MKKYLPPANEVWGKVIFSQACVKNSVHRGGAWFRGGYLLPGGVAWSQERCLVWGGAWSQGGAWWRPPGTATAAGDTHPTGMHSCSIWFHPYTEKNVNSSLSAFRSQNQFLARFSSTRSH